MKAVIDCKAVGIEFIFEAQKKTRLAEGFATRRHHYEIAFSFKTNLTGRGFGSLGGLAVLFQFLSR